METSLIAVCRQQIFQGYQKIRIIKIYIGSHNPSGIVICWLKEVHALTWGCYRENKVATIESIILTLSLFFTYSGNFTLLPEGVHQEY